MAALAPYLLIAAAIAGVIAIIVLCVKHWDEIKAKVVEVAEKIKNKISDMKDSVASKFEELKTKITGAVDNVKGKFNTVVTFFKSNWKELLLLIVNPFAGAFALLYKHNDKFRSKVDELKNKVVNIFETLKNKVMGIFSKIKLNFPNIKMPHFKVTPSGWEIGDLLKGSIPKLGIDWYAKAMDDGMIMNKPTVFGVNSKGQLMGGGESGSETVVGTQSLMNMINNAVNQSNNGLYDVLDKILAVLKNIDNSMYDRIVAADYGY